ncbi:hypothetical protein GGI12_004349 [Dipsacomyces acuminosporus]|nr:hypothetical protein GGI12_004349 [Dipsacomyces acuminosporus]
MASGVEAPSIITGRNPVAYSTSDPLILFIVQLLVIVCICRFLHVFLKKINQPSVIAEIIGGILLGPTVLGRWKAFSTNVFPPQSLTNLNLVANFGLVLFLFMVGLELDPRVLKRNLHRSVAISVAGMILPFALGIATSYALYHILDGTGKFVNFLLFCGVAMAITAFPVLARILTEQNLLKTTVGSIAISAAAIDDVVSWCLLALVVALTNNASGLSALWVFLVGAAWSLFILFVVKPIYIWYLRRNGCLVGREPSQMVLFVTFMMVLISAFFTDAIGIHAIFGGFLIGVIVPHDGGFAIKVTEKIEDVVQIFFLPIYFALSGLKTNLSDLNDGKTWGLLILICVVAFVGKIVGCSVAAKFSNFTWRESVTIGFLMNCKGLVELIVLNIGLQAGVINTKVFTMMVVKALVTTFVTTPAVVWLYPPKYQRRLEEAGGKEDDDAQSAITRRHGPEAGSPMHLLIVLSRLQQVPSLMTLLGYLHHQPELSGARKLTSGENSKESAVVKPKTIHGYLYRPIRVFGLRLLELTSRNSSIMHQYESELQVVTDPVMSMFRAFARVANMIFHASLSYSDPEHFVDTVLGSSRDADAELTIVSAFGHGNNDHAFISTSASSANPLDNVSPGWFTSMGWGFTTAQQAAFITSLFDKSETHVGVFIDCGLSNAGDFAAATTSNELTRDTTSPEKENQITIATEQPAASHVPNPLYFADGRRVPLVVIPFFGGPDDRQALRLAADLCTHSSVQVVVWRFVKADGPTNMDVVLHEDKFPARPTIPETPAPALHHKSLKDEVDPWNHTLGNRSDLAAVTRVGGNDRTETEALEKQEDEIFIDTCLRPRPLESPSAVASPNGPGATQTITPPPGKLDLDQDSADSNNAQSPAATASSQGEPLAAIPEDAQSPQLASGGLRQKLAQKLRLRSNSSAPTNENNNLKVTDSWDTEHEQTEGLTLNTGVRATQYSNMTIETIVTGTPLQTFLLRARSLSSPDLVICGRSVRVSLDYFNNSQELSAYTPAGHANTKLERQRALGTVTEYLLGFGTNASILVIQSSKDPLGGTAADINKKV